MTGVGLFTPTADSRQSGKQKRNRWALVIMPKPSIPTPNQPAIDPIDERFMLLGRYNISRQCQHGTEDVSVRIPPQFGMLSVSAFNRKLSRMAMRPCRACQIGGAA